MSTEIIKVLDDLSKRFGVAIDWTSQNITPYIQDFIKRVQYYKVTTNAIAAIGIVAIITIAIIWFIKLFKRHKDDGCYIDVSDMEFAMNILFGVVGGVAVIALPFVMCYLLQAIFIPELTIIKEISALLP